MKEEKSTSKQQNKCHVVLKNKHTNSEKKMLIYIEPDIMMNCHLWGTFAWGRERCYYKGGDDDYWLTVKIVEWPT